MLPRRANRIMNVASDILLEFSLFKRFSDTSDDILNNTTTLFNITLYIFRPFLKSIFDMS